MTHVRWNKVLYKKQSKIILPPKLGCAPAAPPNTPPALGLPNAPEGLPPPKPNVGELGCCAMPPNVGVLLLAKLDKIHKK